MLANGSLTTAEVIEAGNETYQFLMERLTNENSTINSGNMSASIAIVFRLAFAFVESNVGLEAAQQSFYHAMGYMMDAMNEGAWDEEKQKVK